MSDGDDIRVQLARMEGKQDVTNERLETANRINDERHAAVKVHLGTLDLRLHGHGNRIGVLEARNHLNDGERKGLALSGRLIWALVGAAGATGIGAAALRLLGG